MCQSNELFVSPFDMKTGGRNYEGYGGPRKRLAAQKRKNVTFMMQLFRDGFDRGKSAGSTLQLPSRPPRAKKGASYFGPALPSQ